MSISVNQNTINAKSIDVIITDDFFQSTDIFIVTNTSLATPSTLQIVKVVYSADFSTATLIFSDSTLLALNSNYEINVKRNNLVLASASFTYSDIISIDSATLTCNGTNFFTLSFNYPVKFDDSITLNSGKYSPFYALPENLPIGAPNIPIRDSKGFLWTHSANLKSVNIESAQNSFNIGDISLFTNFPTSGADDANYVWAKEYEAGNSNIPTIYSKGTVPSVSKTQTTVCGINQYNNSKQTIIVKFTAPILYLAQTTQLSTVLTITQGTTFKSTVTTVTRPDYNSSNELLFNLASPLLPGVYDVSVSSILDANGNPSKLYTGLLVITDIPPVVQSANATDSFTVVVNYNTLMSVITEATDPHYTSSSLNPANYSITSINGTAYSGIVNAALETTPLGGTSTQVTLTLSKPLAFGQYKLIVSNVISKAGLSLVSNTAQFVFNDQTATTVNLIGYYTGTVQNPATTNFTTDELKVVAIYNKPMVINGSTHAADNEQNFLVKTSLGSTPFYYLDSTTVIKNVSAGNNQNQFLIPLTQNVSGPTPPPLDLTTITMGNFRLSVGYNEYVSGKNLSAYVESTSGSQVQVQNTGYAISNYAKPMSFCNTTNASMFLMPPNQILYSYDEANNYNQFFQLNSNNLTFTLTGGIAADEEITLSSAVINKNTILFTFANPIDLDALNIIVEQSEVGSILDFFGGNVLFPTNNKCTLPLKRDKVKPIVKTASLVAMDSSKAKVALFFNKEMKYCDNDDIIIYDNLNNPLLNLEDRILVSNATQVPNPPFDASYKYLPQEAYLNIIEINGDVVNSFINSSNAILTAQTNLDDNQLETIDINSNSITNFTKSITNFKTKSFTWELADTNNVPASTSSDSIFTMTFARALNTEWFDAFKFATAVSGHYTLTSTSTCNYLNSNGQPVALNNGDALPSNSLITNTLTIISPTHNDNILGEITVKYYSMNSTGKTVDLSQKAIDVSFSTDSKSIIIVVKAASTKAYLTGLVLASAYCEPSPYVLVASDEMAFVNISYNAITTTPIISFTPIP